MGKPQHAKKHDFDGCVETMVRGFYAEDVGRDSPGISAAKDAASITRPS
jgi:hypothetical protein